MRSQANSGLLAIVLMVASVTGLACTQEPLLWYEHPAEKWAEAIPVGNGRMSGMIFGGINDERIALNEDSIWSGQTHFNSNPKMCDALPVVRRLVFDGRFAEGADWFLREAADTTDFPARTDHEDVF